MSITLFIKFLQNSLHLPILIKISIAWKLTLQVKYMSDVEINLHVYQMLDKYLNLIFSKTKEVYVKDFTIFTRI